MKSVIIGTAGHVDHGKTALVKALTGVDTDRWEEERERGITIDLGFASFPSESDELELSVVDVPGHEDFVKNMLAGASGIDLLLLVVAADEGPMPQTLEHLWIARLLGVERGVAVISKSDLVDREWRDLVADSVREELVNVFGPVDWPVVHASAVSGDGLDELKSAILRAADEAHARLDDDLFRMPVDRSFSVRGVGTVATGTVWSGRIAAGDEVRILPGDRAARVRGVQVHDRDVEGARAGQRAALALVGVDRVQLGRGHLLVSDPVWRETRYLDARLQLLPGAPWALKDQQRLRFHLGTAETLARVVLYDAERVQPGGQAMVQIRLERPVVARAGDRFVVRFYSPVTTIGGGVVVDPWAVRRSRAKGLGTEGYREFEEASVARRTSHVLRARDGGATADEIALLAGASPADVAAALEQLARDGVARQVDGRWHPEESLRAAREATLERLAAGHARQAGARGVSLQSLRSAIGAPALVNAVIADLQREGAIRIEGSVAALADHVPSLDAGQQAIAAAAAASIRAAALSPPTLKELAADLEVREDAVLAALKFLADEGSLVPVTPDLYYDPGAISQAKELMRGLLGKSGAATPSQLRGALGVSRKYLIPLLEYLDAEGFTRRTAEGRVLREGA
jgi:selenocysteine-specific elongation factor